MSTRTPAASAAPVATPDTINTDGGATAVRTALDKPAEVLNTNAKGDVAKGSYTIAPGRTVDGKAPGDTVELDDGDAKRLHDLGFIVGQDGSVVLHTEGPKVVSGTEIVER